MTVSEVHEQHQYTGIDSPTELDVARVVIFGITGDLSRKKLLPAIYDLANRGLLPASFSLVGFARNGQDIDAVVRESVIRYARTSFDPDVLADLLNKVHVVQGTFDDTAAYLRLAKTLSDIDQFYGTAGNYVFYLSIPPKWFSPVCDQLDRAGLSRSADGWRRVVVEKPFGHDRRSSNQLNSTLERAFMPETIYRIDHYLGKETVQNILALRFANGMFEPLWNNRHIDHVQITMAESVGVDGRAGYYDGVGAARDVIQNHLLQLLSLIAMEEPATFDSASISIEKLKVLSATRLVGPLSETTAHGQYSTGEHNGVTVDGLLDAAGFAPDSNTETFAALTLEVSTRRWAGVPFFVRTGKRLARRMTEIAITFTPPAHNTIHASTQSVANVLVLRVQPDDGIELEIGAKSPGAGMDIQPVTLGMDFRAEFEPAPEAYERLLADVLRGDATLFPSSSEVERSWGIIDPLLHYWSTRRPDGYAPGSSGPQSADQIIERTGRRWRRI